VRESKCCSRANSASLSNRDFGDDFVRSETTAAKIDIARSRSPTRRFHLRDRKIRQRTKRQDR
jgi:hypothetical protein